MLGALQHDSRQSVAKIAADTALRHHSVVYIVSQLKERGVITPYVLTNPHALGLTDYCVFFNSVGKEKSARKKIVDFCLKSTQVAYFAELSGPYQFSVSLFCRTVFEVTEFFSALGKILPRSNFETSFALRLEFTQFPGRWLNQTSAHILDRRRVPEVTIDATDRKILVYHSQNATASLHDVAVHAAVSESTVRNRLARMEKDRVIRAFPYLVDATKIHVTTFRIILSASGPGQSVRNKFYAYMAAHPRATGFVHCAGAWDFELAFDLEDSSEMSQIMEDFTDRFSGLVRKLHTVHEIAVHRAHHFPRDAGKSVCH